MHGGGGAGSFQQMHITLGDRECNQSHKPRIRPAHAADAPFAGRVWPRPRWRDWGVVTAHRNDALRPLRLPAGDGVGGGPPTKRCADAGDDGKQGAVRSAILGASAQGVAQADCRVRRAESSMGSGVAAIITPAPQLSSVEHQRQAQAAYPRQPVFSSAAVAWKAHRRWRRGSEIHAPDGNCRWFGSPAQPPGRRRGRSYRRAAAMAWRSDPWAGRMITVQPCGMVRQRGERAGHSASMPASAKALASWAETARSWSWQAGAGGQFPELGSG